MSMLHDKSSWYSQLNLKEKIWLYLNKKLSSLLPLRTGRNYAVVLCNDSRVNLLVLFWTMCNSVKGPWDIKSLKILTAYDVWFLRYQSSNMKLATDSALVIVLINFLWAVYEFQSNISGKMLYKSNTLIKRMIYRLMCRFHRNEFLC